MNMDTYQGTGITLNLDGQTLIPGVQSDTNQTRSELEEAFLKIMTEMDDLQGSINQKIEALTTCSDKDFIAPVLRAREIHAFLNRLVMDWKG